LQFFTAESPSSTAPTAAEAKAAEDARDAEERRRETKPEEQFYATIGKHSLYGQSQRKCEFTGRWDT